MSDRHLRRPRALCLQLNMASTLSKFIPSLRRHHGPAADATESPSVEDPVDAKNEKGDVDVDSDTASKEVTTAADPELNPGGLTFEEGAQMRFFSFVSYPTLRG